MGFRPAITSHRGRLEVLYRRHYSYEDSSYCIATALKDIFEQSWVYGVKRGADQCT